MTSISEELRKVAKSISPEAKKKAKEKAKKLGPLAGIIALLVALATGTYKLQKNRKPQFSRSNVSPPVSNPWALKLLREKGIFLVEDDPQSDTIGDLRPKWNPSKPSVKLVGQKWKGHEPKHQPLSNRIQQDSQETLIALLRAEIISIFHAEADRYPGISKADVVANIQALPDSEVIKVYRAVINPVTMRNFRATMDGISGEVNDKPE